MNAKRFLIPNFQWRTYRLLLLWLGVAAIAFLNAIQMYQLMEQQKGILDHVPSNVMKPLYNWHCPKVVILGGDKNQTTVNCTIPRIFMIQGRPKRPFRAVQSWGSLPWPKWNLETVPTQPFLDQMVRTNETRTFCRRNKPMNWDARLFRIYQQVFAKVLQEHPNDTGFLFVEDDVVLRSPQQLHAEVCVAQDRNLDFYSFFHTPKAQQGRCTYEYGMLAFYASAAFVQHLRDVSADTVCRLPIDMYIASIGPWYASTHSIVQHVGRRYHPSIQ